MTLERIAFEDKISSQQLDEVAKAVEETCQTIGPLELTVDHLAGPRALSG
jgi:hypothetical protein